MFLDKYATKHSTILTMFDMYCAKSMFNIVRRIKPGLSWRKSKWADEFRLLRKEINDDTDRIEQVLEWLASPASVGLRPTSAKWFRNNFSWLEERANKGKVKQSGFVPPPELIAFMKELKGKRLRWPDSCKDDLEEFINLSFINYMKLRARVKEVWIAVRIEWHRILWSHFRDINLFMMKWVTSTHELIHKWENWSGRLKGLHFSIDNKHFVTMAKGWCAAYYGSKKANVEWDHLKQCWEFE